MKNKEVDSLLRFIDSSPTPYHAVANIRKDLRKQDAIELKEDENWSCEAGKTYFVIRKDSSIISFEIPAKGITENSGFNIVAAHTDSPCLKLKPLARKSVGNYQQWGVEIYGGVLLNSWLDRDLCLSGRVSYMNDGELQHKLISIDNKFFRVPQLAIHLDREVNKGLVLNAETHMVPVLGLDSKEDLNDEILRELKVKGLKANDLKSLDLFFHDAAESTYGGLKDEFIYAPRLDNLAMAHASCVAQEKAKPSEKVSVVALFDHEEVGSESAQGAGSNFLSSTLERIGLCFKKEREDFLQMLSRSFLISADMAHAFHPNYTDRHDSEHRPLINKGPVIKTNARQRYATDSKTFARFAVYCDQAEVPYQVFAGRNDIPCGSTVGPIVSTRLGIDTLDVGNPQLSMHSIREMAGSKDHKMMIKAFSEMFKE
ncbi:MAG: M18 family aminopeptidase [Lentisphaeraceae bacterium]|nr:M18 family aminopeptidase [Lentisphaeraceae bacterium]